MREIKSETIVEEVKRLCIEASYYLNEEVSDAFKKAKEKEESPIGRDILDQLLENAAISNEGEFPLCQDTGFAVVYPVESVAAINSAYLWPNKLVK